MNEFRSETFDQKPKNEGPITSIKVKITAGCILMDNKGNDLAQRPSALHSFHHCAISTLEFSRPIHFFPNNIRLLGYE